MSFGDQNITIDSDSSQTIGRFINLLANAPYKKGIISNEKGVGPVAGFICLIDDCKNKFLNFNHLRYHQALDHYQIPFDKIEEIRKIFLP